MNNDDIVKKLRDRACPSGLPHTGDNPEEDHGHTDCWLYHQAADEIERLQKRLQTHQSKDSFALTDDVITQNERSLLAEVEQLHSQIRNLRGPDKIIFTPEIVEAPISDLIEQLQEEIEWLKSLITEWANADDAYSRANGDGYARNPYKGRFLTAMDALRKAVGR
jgi:DNA repair exonuclease SbcCD ATPase subunit